MKKYFVVLLLVFGVMYGQSVNETFDGVNHKIYNAYTEASYTSSTATDTTGWIPIKGARSIALWATATDSLKAVTQFQFKNSFTGYTTDFRATADSVSIIGTTSSLASDRIHAFATSDTSITGYDQIRVRIDFVTWLGVAYTGGTARIYVDIYKP